MLLHHLDETDQLRLDDPVCEYIPEFAKHGKRWITIRHVLTHRAGIPNISSDAMRLEQATHDRNAARARIHNTYRTSTLAFGVLPPLLLGIAMFLRRSSRAAAIVPPSRQVSGHAGHQAAGHGGVK